jgi:hypothetical protein
MMKGMERTTLLNWKSNKRRRPSEEQMAMATARTPPMAKRGREWMGEREEQRRMVNTKTERKQGNNILWKEKGEFHR